MGYKFLSEDWANAVTAALNAHPGFMSSIANADLGLQFDVSDAPDGAISYYMKASGGSAELALGTDEGADVTVGQTYETATAISKGELNTQTAFMTGKLKVEGDMSNAMQLQGVLSKLRS